MYKNIVYRIISTTGHRNFASIRGSEILKMPHILQAVPAALVESCRICSSSRRLGKQRWQWWRSVLWHWHILIETHTLGIMHPKYSWWHRNWLRWDLLRGIHILVVLSHFCFYFCFWTLLVIKSCSEKYFMKVEWFFKIFMRKSLVV